MAATIAPTAPTSPALAGLLPALACPACRGGLRDAGAAAGSALACESCGARYPVEGGVPILLDPESKAMIDGFRDAAENVALRRAIGGRSRALLRVVDILRPPHPFAFMRRRVNRAARVRFSEVAAAGGEREGARFLDIGSGILGGLNASGLSPYVRDRIVPLEIAPTSGVGVVGDAHKLPWREGSLDGVLIQGVLEHVRDPEQVVAEIFRVLRPGAPVLAEVPFVQHYHLDPVDFRRWTHYGFEKLFGAFDVVSAGVCAGPASALTDMLTEFPALLFRRPSLYWGVKLVSGWVFSPIQLLDAIWSRSPRSEVMAGAVFCLARKPGGAGPRA